MVHLSHTIQNPEVDLEIQKTFSSQKLEKKFLFYNLNGKSYNVLLIQNLKKLKLVTTGEYNTSQHGRRSYTRHSKRKA
jgi:hypothetical protein